MALIYVTFIIFRPQVNTLLCGYLLNVPPIFYVKTSPVVEMSINVNAIADCIFHWTKQILKSYIHFICSHAFAFGHNSIFICLLWPGFECRQLGRKFFFYISICWENLLKMSVNVNIYNTHRTHTQLVTKQLSWLRG